MQNALDFTSIPSWAVNRPYEFWQDDGPIVKFIKEALLDSDKPKFRGRTLNIFVSRFRRAIRFDADWLGTGLALTPEAAHAISSRWDAEWDPHRKIPKSCGSLKGSLLLDVYPEKEQEWREFLKQLLENPKSWKPREKWER